MRLTNHLLIVGSLLLAGLAFAAAVVIAAVIGRALRVFL